MVPWFQGFRQQLLRSPRTIKVADAVTLNAVANLVELGSGWQTLLGDDRSLFERLSQVPWQGSSGKCTRELQTDN